MKVKAEQNWKIQSIIVLSRKSNKWYLGTLIPDTLRALSTLFTVPTAVLYHWQEKYYKHTITSFFGCLHYQIITWTFQWRFAGTGQLLRRIRYRKYGWHSIPYEFVAGNCIQKLAIFKVICTHLAVGMKIFHRFRTQVLSSWCLDPFSAATNKVCKLSAVQKVVFHFISSTGILGH